MANKIINELTVADTPLTGDEVAHFLQGANSRRVSVDAIRGPKLASLADLGVSEGDLLYVNSSGLITRLPKGTARQVLRQNSGLTAPEWTASTPVLQSPIPTTSGTSKDITDIPSWVRRINLHLAGVSVSGASPLLIQLGDSGGIETSGYIGCTAVLPNGNAVTAVNHSTGFQIFSNSTANVIDGTIELSMMDESAFQWSANGTIGFSSSAVAETVTGTKSLSAALDRIRLTTVNGTDTFDAGKISVSFE